jgi:prepilin-type N-terminal cleavage/methylation domain-containing protein
MPNLRGFTLIEVLMVVGIIGILTTIIITISNQVRKESHDVRAINHAKQIVLAAEQYHLDHGQYPPMFAMAEPTGCGLPGYQSTLDWCDLEIMLAPYLSPLPRPQGINYINYYYEADGGDDYQTFGVAVGVESKKFRALQDDWYFSIGPQVYYCDNKYGQFTWLNDGYQPQYDYVCMYGN